SAIPPSALAPLFDAVLCCVLSMQARTFPPECPDCTSHLHTPNQGATAASPSITAHSLSTDLDTGIFYRLLRPELLQHLQALKPGLASPYTHTLHHSNYSTQ